MPLLQQPVSHRQREAKKRDAAEATATTPFRS
jgi:hypothetical protein